MRMKSRFRKRATVGTTAPKKPKPAPKPFDAQAALEMALAALSKPPKRADTERREPVGLLKARWILPLSCAPTANRMIEMGRFGTWSLDSAKRKVRKLMLEQCGRRRAKEPLAGRPHIRIVPFSHNIQDWDQSRTKFILDRLQRGQKRKPKKMADHVWALVKDKMPPVDLNWIAGDRRDQIDLATWPEACAPGQGCVLVELYTGAA